MSTIMERSSLDTVQKDAETYTLAFEKENLCHLCEQKSVDVDVCNPLEAGSRLVVLSCP